MVSTIILRNSLYGVIGTSIVRYFPSKTILESNFQAIYLALLTMFAVDGGYAAIAFSAVGIISGIIGILGVKWQNFPMLMTVCIFTPVSIFIFCVVQRNVVFVAYHRSSSYCHDCKCFQSK